MKTEKNIFIAFILNLFFSVFEFVGGLFIGSYAIISDSLHDFGDALSIGLSYFFERKSKKAPDEKFTFGYTRYSVLGSVITGFILIFGSVIIMMNSFLKLCNPSSIKYNEMIVFAIIGIVVNLCGMYITNKGISLNQKIVNIHMLEDVLGWLTILISAVVMKITKLTFIDPLISIVLSIFIIIHALKHIKEAFLIFLESVPVDIDLQKTKEEILHIHEVIKIEELHIWSIDEENICVIVKVVATDNDKTKEKVKDLFVDTKKKRIFVETVIP